MMKNMIKGAKRISLVILVLLIVFSAMPLSAAAYAEGSRLLYAGGIPFGVKFYSEGVIVAGFDDMPASVGGERNPAERAGLIKNDIILTVDGVAPNSCEEFVSMISKSEGRTLKIVYMRDGEQRETELTPVYSPDEGKFKCGIFIRQGGAGIGTVTYIDPESLSFGGLGHAICDTDSGKILPISHGITMNVSVSGIIKGKPGAPGELRGSFASGKTGIVYSNMPSGVFGVFSSLPSGIEAKKYPVGKREELHNGKAYIISTLDGSGKPEKYEIEISGIKLDADSEENKCFTIKVKDRALIEKTGGIVQGMSGSPIIQGAKLVGAVTHVMISDPTVGYGIFIENMLEGSKK